MYTCDNFVSSNSFNILFFNTHDDTCTHATTSCPQIHLIQKEENLHEIIDLLENRNSDLKTIETKLTGLKCRQLRKLQHDIAIEKKEYKHLDFRKKTDIIETLLNRCSERKNTLPVSDDVLLKNILPFLDHEDIQNFKIISRNNIRTFKKHKLSIHTLRVDSYNYKKVMAEYETIVSSRTNR